MSKKEKNAETIAQETIHTTVEQQEDTSVQESMMYLPEGVTTIVIPYVKEFAQGNELLYALRSIASNATFNYNIVIIGDAEEWFNPDCITHIPHKRCSDNPQVDVLSKLQIAIDSHMVSEDFVWSNDDIYLVNRISLAHIAVPKVLGELKPDKYKGIYAANMQRTIDALKSENLPTLNYGTHTPVLFNKQRLLAMFRRFGSVIQEGALISSLYFNLQAYVQPVFLNFRTDQVALTILSQQPDGKLVRELLARKVFLNNAVSGHSPWLESFLADMFQIKTTFERFD